MALPKKIKKDIDIKVVNPESGPQRWVDQFLEQNKQFLPRSVDFADLDAGLVGFVNDDLGFELKGEKVPVHFLTLQRWNEFTKLWPNTDKYKNIKIPFVSVVRRPNPETGTNPADFKIPVRKNFPYMQIPIWNGSRNGADIYGIPNPVGVDLTYTVRFFSFRMRELNKLHQKVLQTFASAQAYVNIKGHYFPILLESIGDESQVDDLEGKRFYVVVQFLPGAPTTLRFSTDNKTNFSSVGTDNITTYTIHLNGSPVSVPFVAEPTDQIIINIVKTDSNKISEINLRGLIII